MSSGMSSILSSVGMRTTAMSVGLSSVGPRTSLVTSPISSMQTLTQNVGGSSQPIQIQDSTTMAPLEIPLDIASNLTSMLREVRNQVAVQNDTSTMLMNQVARLQQEMISLSNGSPVSSQPSIPSIFQSVAPSAPFNPFSPYQPRRLSFGSEAAGSSGFGTNIPASSLATESTIIHPEVTIPTATSTVLPTLPMTGSTNPLFEFNPFNAHFQTNHDAGSLLGRQMQELKDLVMSVPGITLPHNQASPTCYNESRFTPAIANVVIPKKFSPPHMKQYDGTTDPAEHVALYQDKMDVVLIPPQYREACFCKGIFVISAFSNFR
ncbi:hypothetical protein OROMI_025486 [Orobanche minor]